MSDAYAIAVQGVGYGALAMAGLGLLEEDAPIVGAHPGNVYRGRLFNGRLFAGQLFGRRARRAAAIAGGGNWMAEPVAAETRKRRPQIQATNMMLIAALIAVAQGDEDGWSA